MAYDAATAARVRAILSGRRNVVETKLMGGLAFMVAGTMACSVGAKGGLLIRVGAEGMGAALREPNASPMTMGSKTMSGFVRIAPEGFRTDTALRKWVRRGVDVAVALSLRKREAKRPAPSRTRRGPG